MISVLPSAVPFFQRAEVAAEVEGFELPALGSLLEGRGRLRVGRGLGGRGDQDRRGRRLLGGWVLEQSAGLGRQAPADGVKLLRRPHAVGQVLRLDADGVPRLLEQSPPFGEPPPGRPDPSNPARWTIACWSV